MFSWKMKLEGVTKRGKKELFVSPWDFPTALGDPHEVLDPRSP